MSGVGFEALSAGLGQVAAALLVVPPAEAGGVWLACRPGAGVARPATNEEIQARLQASEADAAIALALLHLGDEAAAAGLDLLVECAAATADLARAAEACQAQWEQVQRLVSWATDRTEM
jgi:hypothetical protein